MENNRLGTERTEMVAATEGNSRNQGHGDSPEVVQQQSAATRRAHPGGPIVTNKAVALAQFLKRKLSQPGGLESLDPALVEKAVLNAKACIRADANPCAEKTAKVRHVISFSCSESESDSDESGGELHCQNGGAVSRKQKSKLNGKSARSTAKEEEIRRRKEEECSKHQSEDDVHEKLKTVTAKKIKRRKRRRSQVEDDGVDDDHHDDDDDERREKKRKKKKKERQAIDGTEEDEEGKGRRTSKNWDADDRGGKKKKKKMEIKLEKKRSRSFLEHMKKRKSKGVGGRKYRKEGQEQRAKEKKRRIGKRKGSAGLRKHEERRRRGMDDLPKKKPVHKD